MSNDTLPTNAFIGRPEPPEEADIAAALGSAKPAWDGLIAKLAEEHGVSTHEWKSYSRKSGWALRLLRGKRTIVWMAPCAGCFHVGFILGDKAMADARAGKPSARLLKLLDEGKRYPEGTGVSVYVKSQKELPVLEQLAVIKIRN